MRNRLCCIKTNDCAKNKPNNMKMKQILILAIILTGFVNLFAQDVKLITKNTKNPHTTEEYYVLKSNKNIKHGLYQKRLYDNRLASEGFYKRNKKDSIWIFYAYNGIDTASIGWYKENNPTGIWTINDNQNRVRYKFDYDKNEVISYNWYETPNSFPILTDSTWIEKSIDSPPLIIGKENPMQSVYRSLRYPVRAMENGISGQVLISFIVDKNGNVSDFKVKKGVDKDLDAEALRAAKLIDKNWYPAKLNGQEITIEYFIPINFVLQ